MAVDRALGYVKTRSDLLVGQAVGEPAGDVGLPVRERWLGPAARPLRVLLLSPFVSQRMVFFIAQPGRADLAVLSELLDSGKVTPVIDRTFPLSETAAAIRYREQGHAAGKVVVTL